MWIIHLTSIIHLSSFYLSSSYHLSLSSLDQFPSFSVDVLFIIWSYSPLVLSILYLFASHLPQPPYVNPFYVFFSVLFTKKETTATNFFLVSLKNLKEQPSSKPPSLHTLFYKFTFLPFSLYNIQNGTLMSSVNKTYLNGINPFYVLLFVKSFLYTKIK